MKDTLILKYCLLCVCFLTSYQVMAQGTFLNNGILYYYESITAKTVAVSTNGYTGDIVIPESTSFNGTDYTVTEIAVTAFYDCKGLTSITLPASLTTIGSAAFYDCSGLVSITIPSKVTSIQANTFTLCTNLRSAVLPDGLAYIGEVAFIGCSSLESINIPSSVSAIGNGAFNGNASLKSITIPNGISDINISTFKNCTSLTSIVLPGSVTSLRENAFNNCNKITTFTALNSEPPTAFANSFELMDFSNCQLRVPIGSKDKYAAATGWNQFGNIVEIDATGVENTANEEIKVYKEADQVVIKGAESGEEIQVYTESGTLLNTVQVKENMHRFKLPENKIYIIQIGRTTHKVVL